MSHGDNSTLPLALNVSRRRWGKELKRKFHRSSYTFIEQKNQTGYATPRYASPKEKREGKGHCNYVLRTRTIQRAFAGHCRVKVACFQSLDSFWFTPEILLLKISYASTSPCYQASIPCVAFGSSEDLASWDHAPQLPVASCHHHSREYSNIHSRAASLQHPFLPERPSQCTSWYQWWRESHPV